MLCWSFVRTFILLLCVLCFVMFRCECVCLCWLNVCLSCLILRVCVCKERNYSIVRQYNFHLCFVVYSWLGRRCTYAIYRCYAGGTGGSRFVFPKTCLPNAYSCVDKKLVVGCFLRSSRIFVPACHSHIFVLFCLPPSIVWPSSGERDHHHFYHSSYNYLFSSSYHIIVLLRENINSTSSIFQQRN